MMLRDNRGFTLVEMIVAMAVFIFVIMIATDAFNLIIVQASKLIQSEESNIEGMVGLEQFRHDLQQAGFGLPYAFVNSDGSASASDPVYEEAANAPASSYNDAPSRIPRAFTSGNNLSGVGTIVNGSDYLVIRGTSVARSNASQKWTYMTYSSATPTPRTWQSASENIPESAWVIVLRRTFSNGRYVNQLVLDPDESVNSNLYFGVNYFASGFAPSGTGTYPFNPASPNDIYFIYGIDEDDIRMPFNRTDYFVSRPTTANSMPAMCAPSTGILYKGTINQDGGATNYSLPLMDCIADMQVIYGWDLKNAGSDGNDGIIDTYSNADGSAAIGEASNADVAAAMGSAETLRNSLKLVKIFVLAQNGKMDRNYTSPATYALFDTGETSLGHTYTLSSAMRNYRWKVYRIVARPKNLTGNN